jgi:hypothetical protein
MCLFSNIAPALLVTSHHCNPPFSSGCSVGPLVTMCLPYTLIVCVNWRSKNRRQHIGNTYTLRGGSNARADLWHAERLNSNR